MAAPAAILNIFITANSTQATAAMARTQTQLKALEAQSVKSSGRFATAMKTAGKTGALALAAAGAAGIKMGMDFEDAMVQISTQAGASMKEVERMQQPILDLARASEFGPEELAKGLFRVESAGYRGAKALEVLRAASDLADVGHADLEETTRAFVAAIRSGIKGTQDFNQAAGTMNAIVGQGSMRMGDLVSAFGTGLLPRAKAVGVSLAEVGAALGVLTEQGMGASQSATRLGMTFSFMVRKPTADAEEAMNRLGIAQGQMAEMLLQPNGLLKVLTLLHDRLQKIPEAQRAALLGQMFGGGRSGAAIQVLLNSLDQYEKKLGSVRKESGNFSQAIAEDNKTLASKVAMAWAFIQSVLTQMGLAINQALNWMIVAIPKVIQAFKDLGIWVANAGKWVSRAAQNFVGFITSLLPVKAALFIIAGAFKMLMGAIRPFLPLIKFAAGLFGVVLWQALKMAWQGMKTFGNIVGNVVGIVSNLLRGDFAGAWRNVEDLVGGVIGHMKNMIKSFGSVAISVFNAIRDPVVGTAHAVVNALKGIVRAVAQVIQKFQNLADKLPKLPEIDVGGGFDLNKGLLENLGITGQRGLMVPGSGSGDKIHALLEPGEVVLNRRAVAAMGGARKANAINQLIPRFAEGGMIAKGVSQVGSSGVGMAAVAGASLMQLVKKLAKRTAGGDYGAAGNIVALGRMLMKRGYSVGEHPAFGGVDPVHVPNSWHYRGRAIDISGGNLDRLYKQLKASGLHFLELLWRVPGHYDHIHAALQAGGIAPPARNGKPHASWRKLFGSTFDKNELTTLAAFVGMRNPALMAAIAMGESSGIPGRVGDGGDSIGLWQINKPSWGGTNAALSNPITNAQYAKRVLRSQGLGAWTIYNTGAYREHLGGKVIQSALQALRGTGGAAGAEGEDKGVPTPMKLLRRLYKQLLPSTLKILTTSVHTAKQHQKRAKKTKSVQDDIDAFHELQGALRQRKDFTAKNKAWLKAKETGKGMRAALQAVVTMMQALQPKPGEPDAADALEDTNLAELNALLKTQAITAQQRLAVSQAQYKTLQSTPYVGPFAGGGVVPGVGAKLATVHGGETITPKGGATTVILIEDGAVDARRIKTLSGAEAQRALRRSARRGNRPLPSRGGGI